MKLSNQYKFRNQRSLLNKTSYDAKWHDPIKEKAKEVFAPLVQSVNGSFQYNGVIMLLTSIYFWKAVDKKDRVTIFYPRSAAAYQAATDTSPAGSCFDHANGYRAVISAVESMLSTFPEAIIEHVIGNRELGRSYFTFDFSMMQDRSDEFASLIQDNILNLSELVTDKDDVLPADLRILLENEVKHRRGKHLLVVDNGVTASIMCDDRLVVHSSQPTSNAIGMRFYSSFNQASKTFRDDNIVIPNVPNPYDVDIVSAFPTFYCGKYGLEMPIIDTMENRKFKKNIVNFSFNCTSIKQLRSALKAEHPELDTKYITKETKKFVKDNKHLEGHMFIGSSFAQEASELETVWQLKLSNSLRKAGIEDVQWIHDGLRCDKSIAGTVALLAIEQANAIIKAARSNQGKIDGVKKKDLTFGKAYVSIKEVPINESAENVKLLKRQKAADVWQNDIRKAIGNKLFNETIERQRNQMTPERERVLKMKIEKLKKIKGWKKIK